jgi:hypothetical protein
LVYLADEVEFECVPLLELPDANRKEVFFNGGYDVALFFLGIC